MSARRTALLGGMVVAAGAIVLALVHGPAWLRTVFGLPLVLLVPGYGLIEAIDPSGRIRAAERLTLALGTSMAIAILTGLLLSASPAGMRTETWLGTLGLFALLTSLFGLQRACSVTSARPASRRPALRSALGAGLLFVACVAVALALVTSHAERPIGSERSVEQGRVSVLQMWVVPGERAASGDVLVGIENPAGRSLDCRLVVTQGDQVLQETELSLPSGYSGTVSVPSGSAGPAGLPLRIVLTDADDNEVLRSLSIWPQPLPGTDSDSEG